ncbi:TetR family transcriptional regulator [Mycolicibacterium porcinum]|uniref:TetR family transcriptional regulator n=1 Tax=Mycolicibacterium porcinum TaxID=39693 RepID=UPI00043126E5|nr:TetR family transcriptional regulator [Mycolicibacterium porcinum]CDO31221.1 transcriptional regulator [Mycolicibacterium vulneris]
MAVHEAIRAARVGARLSLRTLARRIGVSPATMSAIETGKTRVSVERVQAIAEALDVDIRTLIGGMRRPPSLRNNAHGASSPIGGQVSWRDFPPLALDPVLRAAIESFVATGYHGATMRSLAQRAGVSVPSVYHRYRDKQDLLVRILDITMGELHWRVRAARAEGATSVDRVALMVEALALYHTHRRDLAFIGASEMRSLAGANRYRITKSRSDIQYLLDEQIAAAVADGYLATQHPRDAGRAIATMCTSLAQWFRFDGASSPEQIAREYADFALDLLRRD